MKGEINCKPFVAQLDIILSHLHSEIKNRHRNNKTTLN
jgi:hypothetical protein